jgi:hypothetical protein
MRAACTSSCSSSLITPFLLLPHHSLSDFIYIYMLCTRMYVCMYLMVPRALACLCARSGHYLRLGTSYVLAKREQLYFAAAYLEILLLPLMVIKFFQGYARTPPPNSSASPPFLPLCPLVLVAALTPLGSPHTAGLRG